MCVDLAAHPSSNPVHDASRCHHLAGADPRHRLDHLPLLPPGPDGVRNRLLHGGRPGTTFGTWSDGPSQGNSAPHKRISGDRTPLASRLAQPSSSFIAQRAVDFNGKRIEGLFSLDLTSLKNLIFCLSSDHAEKGKGVFGDG